ncbi:MAG: glycoside hydrolase family 172 protein [Armatimonadota bacterium]
MARLCWCVFAGLLALASSLGAEPITFRTLLNEMVDRTAVARLPQPFYQCKQFSSYDRASVSPDKADTWFANGDAGHFLRMEERNGRKEWVMMEAFGPGAVVRIWSANPKGTIRFYLDNFTEPTMEVSMEALLSGQAEIGGVKIGAPLAAVRSGGWNLYLPIPYARYCKITSDANGFYYQINYRTYAPGTPVVTFKPDDLRENRALLEQIQQQLATQFQLPSQLRKQVNQLHGVQPGGSHRRTVRGPAAISLLAVRLSAEDMTTATRTTVLELRFDGKTTVWVPLGEFFGSGVGIHPYSDWWRTVEKEGILWCRWLMPYRKQAEIILHNFAQQPIRVGIAVQTRPWQWDERSLYFHATWRQEYPIPTRPQRDWNYVQISGTGVFVGDTLTVVNPLQSWWGEGDEKIYVDGEKFPSHFGTGTEDYYGYAWCSNIPFVAPFHAQPRCDGIELGGNLGYTTVTRVRTLDAIPFTQQFRMDMEVWHWEECEVAYAATTYFYTRPGATTNRVPQLHEVKRGVLPAPKPPQIAGAIECETMPIVAVSEGVPAAPQVMPGTKDRFWSNGKHLFVQARKPGDFVELRIPVESDAPVKLTLYATKSWDYGIVRFSVNGKHAGGDMDLCSEREGQSVPTGPIELGTFTPENGALILRVEVVGTSEKSTGARYFFGLDCVVLEPSLNASYPSRNGSPSSVPSGSTRK